MIKFAEMFDFSDEKKHWFESLNISEERGKILLSALDKTLRIFLTSPGYSTNLDLCKAFSATGVDLETPGEVFFVGMKLQDLALSLHEDSLVDLAADLRDLLARTFPDRFAELSERVRENTNKKLTTDELLSAFQDLHQHENSQTFKEANVKTDFRDKRS